MTFRIHAHRPQSRVNSRSRWRALTVILPGLQSLESRLYQQRRAARLTIFNTNTLETIGQSGQPGRCRFLAKDNLSMFGTDRSIQSFQLDIHPIADPAEQENCTAWDSVSYTVGIDGGNETTDDCIIFYMFVKPD